MSNGERLALGAILLDTSITRTFVDTSFDLWNVPGFLIATLLGMYLTLTALIRWCKE